MVRFLSVGTNHTFMSFHTRLFLIKTRGLAIVVVVVVVINIRIGPANDGNLQMYAVNHVQCGSENEQK